MLRLGAQTRLEGRILREDQDRHSDQTGGRVLPRAEQEADDHHPGRGAHPPGGRGEEGPPQHDAREHAARPDPIAKPAAGNLEERIRPREGRECPAQFHDRQPEIVPHRRQQNESFLERGVREGWLTPATDRSGHPPPRKPIKGYSFEQLMAELERDREDRF